VTTENISIINILLVLNPKHKVTGRKINSIPAETRTVGKLAEGTIKKIQHWSNIVFMMQKASML